MRKYLFLIVCALVSFSASGQKVALKTNLLGDALITPNLALELRLANKWTLDTYVSYNPFVWNEGIKVQWTAEDAENGKMLKHWMVQPEVRYWTCEAFNGFFLGAHLMGGQHNIAGLEWPPLTFGGGEDGGGVLKPEVRYQGYFMGGGISVGNQWILGNRWNLEASIGAGFVTMKNDEFNPANPCEQYNKDGKLTFSMIWLTKATVSIVYFFN